jgi:predicted extracellular nuclease
LWNPVGVVLRQRRFRFFIGGFFIGGDCLMKLRMKFLGALAALFTIAAPMAQAQVVISQVYGGAGCGTAGCSTYKNDYIELFNRGGSAVSINGWSVQYTSATGTGAWQVTNLPNTTIPPGGYLLVAESAGANGVNNLPTPEVTGTIAMSATAGKVAVVNNITALTGCTTSASIQDFVGYGTTANCNEGGTNAPAPSTTTADLRALNGCTDANNNGTDFSTGTPNARNSASPTNVCGGAGHTNPSGVGAANPNSGLTGSTTLLTVTVTPGTNPVSTGIAVVVDLSPIGGSASQTFFDDGSNGDATPGDNVYSYTATVGAVSSGVKSLTATITDAQAGSSTAPISFTVTLPPVSIMQIQGHGTASLLNGQIVTTNGNVVTAKKSNGFFMQDPLGDGDLTTSDGIFVFTSSVPAVQVGDQVNVTGKVQEFGGSTELSGTPTVTVTSSPAPVQPTAYVLDSHPPTNNPTTGICMGGNSTISSPPTTSDGYQASNFACLDGMLVTMNDATVTGATFGNGASDAVHTGTPTGMYARLSVLNTDRAHARPFRGPGAPYPGFAGHPEIPVSSGEPEVIEIFYAGLAFNPTGFVYDAGTRFTTTGVIQGFQAASATSPIYEIYPYSMATLAAAPTYPQAVADSASGTLTIASQNMLHFFNASADGQDTSGYNDTCAGTGASDTCPTPAEYATRVTKWTKQVCEVLKAPVVIDIEEIENIVVARDLAASVLSACAVTYQPYVLPGNDVSGINIGILVRNDVVVSSVTQMYKGTQTNNCSSSPPCGLNDRPPVLMDATWNGYHFALLAIYDRSLSGLGDPTKPYIGPKRAEQAAQIASIAQAWQSGATLVGAGNARQDATGAITQGPFDIVGNAAVPLIVAGDFNAYEFSDGYADVTGMIMGTADQSKNLYWYNGDAANTDTPVYVQPTPALVDTGAAAKAGQRYSFNFSGLAQEIDHILLSQRGQHDFVSISNAHGNSDVSEATSIILDDTTAARSGDHDGQVVTIAIDRVSANNFDEQP